MSIIIVSVFFICNGKYISIDLQFLIVHIILICLKPVKITHNLDFFQVCKIIYNFDLPKVYKNDPYLDLVQFCKNYL